MFKFFVKNLNFVPIMFNCCSNFFGGHTGEAKFVQSLFMAEAKVSRYEAISSKGLHSSIIQNVFITKLYNVFKLCS